MTDLPLWIIPVVLVGALLALGLVAVFRAAIQAWNADLADEMRLLWLAFIVLAPIVGAITWYAVGATQVRRF